MELNSLLNSETKEQQQLLAEYCRTGNIPKKLDAQIDRLPHYRRLVYNVIFDTFSSAYPITKSFLEEDLWAKLITDCFANFPIQESQVWKMPYCLYEYLTDCPNPYIEKFPFLDELVYFEWIEMELYTEKDIPTPNALSTIDAINLNPHFRILELNYPFHKLAVKRALELEKKSFVILFRHPTLYKIEFLDISVLVAKIIQDLPNYDNNLTYSTTKNATSYNITDKVVIKKQAALLFNQFKELGLFL